VAVTEALWSEVMLALVALKPAVVAPAATVTEAGTVRIALLLDSVTVTAAPPVGAALDRVTVQALVALDPRLAGAHVIEDTSTGATRLMVVLAVPL
jgi:hypothetical protein